MSVGYLHMHMGFFGSWCLFSSIPLPIDNWLSFIMY
jgi:hypothetical protein